MSRLGQDDRHARGETGYVAASEAPPGPAPALRARVALWIAVLVALHIWAAVVTEFSPTRFRNIANSLHFLRNALPPRWEIVPDILSAAVVTLHIALMGTSLALVVALPVAFLAARNTSPSPWVYTAARSLLSFLRAVPEIVFALVLVPAIGLGPFPGVMALFFHNFGVLGKLISEMIEGAHRGPQEAVASTGAARPLVLAFGILPQILPDVLSQAFYRLEVNVRQTIVLGFIGAGGIGHELFLSFRVFQYREVILQVAAIVVLVIAVDYLSSAVRRRVI